MSNHSRIRLRLVAALIAVGGLLGVITTPVPSSAMTYEEIINDPFLHSGHSEVLRLYRAVLDRTPDGEGAAFWLNEYDSGDWTTRRIADHFVNSIEFETVFGSGLDNTEFTEVIYRNVLDREPDSDGFVFWLGQLDAGMARSEMVLLISNAPEFIGRFPLPSDARVNNGPRYPALGFFRSTQADCVAYAARVGNPPPAPERFSGATYAGNPGSGEFVIRDGLGDLLIVFLPSSVTFDEEDTDEPIVIFSIDGSQSPLPTAYSFGCPPDLYLGTLAS